MIWKLSGSEDAMDVKTFNRFFLFSVLTVFIYLYEKTNQRYF